MGEKLSYNDAIALGLDELRRREKLMRDDLNRDPVEYNIIKNAISHLESLEESQKATEELQQKQAEQLDGLLTSVFELGLFEAIKPQPAESERLYEYEEQRKEFYHILYDFIRQQQQSLIDLHNVEIAKRDEQIQTLNQKVLEVQHQLDLANEHIKSLKDEADQAKKEVKEKEDIIEKQKATIAQKDQEIQKLISEKAELSRKLEQKPMQYTPPSGDIAERVNRLKEKSSSVDDMLERFYARNPHLRVPSFEKKEEQPSGESFRGEDSDGGQSVNAVDASGTASAQASVHSQTVNFQPAVMVPEGAGGNDQAVGFEAWAKAEIEALKKRMERVEKRVSIVNDNDVA